MQLDGSIKANRLVREIAYEHWHRALFARFLAENDLLIDPDHKVAVSLSDLEEIAKEEGRDLVELAADWAEPMLPQIFRKDDPVLALALPPETGAGITEIVKSLPHAVFDADDSLGWVYQFWQSDQKNQVNESEVKIGADELSAVTQLFTEDYMVLFLLQNTLGAWWAGKVLAANPSLAANAESEDELRDKTSPPGYRWTYLRFIREPRDSETNETATGPWQAAAGTFEAWPKAARDITVLDPCMGSGHFLVFALPILVAFRCAEEKLNERAAVKSVLAENLFGLEVDPRCTQIAAFALGLASWKRLGGPEPLPRLNLACSGLAIGFGKAEFLKLAERIAAKRGWRPTVDLLGDGATPIENAAINREREGLSRLYEVFEKAPLIGSLINPRHSSKGDFGTFFEASYDQVRDVLGQVLAADTSKVYEERESATTAQGLAAAAGLFGRTYTLVVTNVPYLGRAKMSAVLQEYCADNYQRAKADLATCFVERIVEWCDQGGTLGVVTPQNWTTLTSYADFRRNLLTNLRLNSIGFLGSNAFQDMNWWAANTLLSIATREHSSSGDTYATVDVGNLRETDSKSTGLKFTALSRPRQGDQLNNPDARIVSVGLAKGELLSNHADYGKGSTTGDSPHYLRQFSEWGSIPTGAVPWLDSPKPGDLWSGRSLVCAVPLDNGDLRNEKGCRIHGQENWNRIGIAVNKMNDLAPFFYTGEVFDDNIGALTPKTIEDHLAICAFVTSDSYRAEIRKIDQALKVTAATLTKVNFDREFWRREGIGRFGQRGFLPWSNDPSQWLFDGQPRGSADPNVARDGSTNPRLVTPHGIRPGLALHPLQVAVARLLGYRWPRQTGSSFMDCPSVPEPDEVDRSGLVDTDGIVPLPGLAGDADAAARLRDLIRAIWGADYGEGTIRELLAAEEAKASDLGTWLADEFFDGHCKLFDQTPFIWQVWDGLRGGFSALVNHHRLCEGNGAGRRLLEKLRDSYLGEWIAVQRRAIAAGEAGAEERLIAAEHLRGELTKIIEGDPPYDIFVRWKPLHRQPIGWEPDINDGVRLNIRPFLTARPKNSGRKDGCILRVTPRVKKHAGADRGAEPLREKHDFPWFWAEDHDVETENFAGGAQFKGRRYNDFHYTRAFKQHARAAKARAVSSALSEPVLENQGRTS